MEKLSVLIIDDENSLENIFKKHLDNFNVDFYDHPQKGWKAIDKQKYHLIITDLKMPIIEGDEFIKIIRNSQLNAHTPIILCSGFIEKKILPELTRESKIYFLNKPFDKKTLLESVQKALGSGAVESEVKNHFLPEAWLNKLVAHLDKFRLKKVGVEHINTFDSWNFESINLFFTATNTKDYINVNLLMQKKTFLDIAGKNQGTHYKEIEPEVLIIWQKIIKNIDPTIKKISCTKVLGQTFLTLPEEKKPLYKIETDFGEIYTSIK